MKQEGELMLDHSHSPGFTEAQAHRLGTVAGSVFHEAATYTCTHCACVVMVTPDRIRVRERCRACKQGRFLCDPCGFVLKLNGECYDVWAYVNTVQDMDPSAILAIELQHARRREFMKLRALYNG